MIDRLKAANDRLKRENCKISLCLKDENRKTIMLRGTYPPKPGSTRSRPYSQRLATGLPLNPAGIKQAEKLARKVSADLALNLFQWQDYLSQKPEKNQKQAVSEAIDHFHQDFLNRGGNEKTWHNRYTPTLSKLQSLTPEEFKRVVLTTAPNSRNRQIYYDVSRKFAEFVQVPTDLDGLRGHYQPKKRNIPTDKEIETYRESLKDPAWQWIYGMIAAYGLRTHEVFRIESYNFPEIQISADTKTGKRLCFPLPEHWVKVWSLDTPNLPPLNLERSSKSLSNTVARTFRQAAIPFPPYNLRHAYAIRGIRLNVPHASAARWMGHSLETHNEKYHRWMNAQNDRDIYSKISQG